MEMTLKRFIEVVSGKATTSYALHFSGPGASETRQHLLEMLAERYCENPRVAKPFLDGLVLVEATRTEMEKLTVNAKEVAKICHYNFEFKRVPE